MKLDEVDKKIVVLLQEDARRSFKDMASKIGVSEATVFVRVKKLVKRGVIMAFRAVVNPKLVDKGTLAFILLRANPNKYLNVLKSLMKMEEVYEIYDITGPYYAVLKVRTGSPEELADAIDKIGAISGVTGTETAMVLKSMKEDYVLKV